MTASSRGELRLVDAPYDGSIAAPLIAELQAEYVVRYGGPDETPVRPSEFAPPHGAFVVALLDGEPVGSAALRRHDDDTVELKRMFVRAPYRGTGLGHRLMAVVEERAAALGYRRVVLETGLAQPEALGLYQSAGYTAIDNFGHHRCSPNVRSFEKVLR